MDYYQGVLFPDFDSEDSKSEVLSKNSTKLRTKTLLNLHLHCNFSTEGKEDMPILYPYNSSLPNIFIPFSERNKGPLSCGIHCYLYDYFIEQTWKMPSRIISCLQKYPCVIGPDFSLFVDMPRAINIWNVYRNRWVTSFWQSHSINAIPSASWGNADSFDYCFDGLPKNSIIAIGHTAIGKDKSYKRLFRMGVETLIERKQPTKLLIYGLPLDFNPNIEVVYYESIIQRLRKL